MLSKVLDDLASHWPPTYSCEKGDVNYNCKVSKELNLEITTGSLYPDLRMWTSIDIIMEAG